MTSNATSNAEPAAANAHAPAVASAASPIVAAETSAADPLAGLTLATGKKAKAKRAKTYADTAKVQRVRLFPGIKDADTWTSGRGGWAHVPRSASLIASIVIKEAYRTKYGASSAAGMTYLTVWLHARGHGMSRIENELDAALESGYGGERGITTFRKHMRTLKELGFVDFVEIGRGRIRWVLLRNPYLVTKKLLDDKLIGDDTYAMVFEKAEGIGAGGEFDEETEDGDDAE